MASGFDASWGQALSVGLLTGGAEQEKPATWRAEVIQYATAHVPSPVQQATSATRTSSLE
jgi:hypothetical protein